MTNTDQPLPSVNPKLSIPGGTILTDTLLQVFRHSILNKIYSESAGKDPLELINKLLDLLDLKIDLPEEDIKRRKSENRRRKKENPKSQIRNPQ